MPGKNNGTGCPVSFRCWKCRREASHLKLFGFFSDKRGYYTSVELTGRETPYASASCRMDTVNREYRCLDCGHVGWSRHIDLRHAVVAVIKEKAHED